MPIRYSDDAKPTMDEVVELYRTVRWSSARKPETLHAGLLASHALVTAWDGALLVGIGNAISDGHLVVYSGSRAPAPPSHCGSLMATNMIERAVQPGVAADGAARR